MGNPEILLHPTIPHPLHGLAPRTLMTNREWQALRKETLEKAGYRCQVCDRQVSLDVHEQYDIDYQTARAVFCDTVAVCKFCHNFIHSGRLLSMVLKGERTEEYAVRVFQHGIDQLKPIKKIHVTQTEAIWFAVQEFNDIDFGLLLELINELDGFDVIRPEAKETRWEDWRLVFRGEEYQGKFRNYEEWRKHYG